ncbi:DEAD/DEAH box helicase family protein [Methanohalophilus portucalensis]|uniref:Restriction endonuclease subunit R n=2 Tax=Methanohalophilus portucalensis TaxID=39664 RepID=A0A1L9C590_9EURY|nr:DEAD/DEAH box helicase family protein [Methanohalophilus portucalensis]ATU08337.1 restriction endonuclease subunit R [Methanohalophilus portucalensis]OJH49664.1 type III restriction enzyme, res subunit [Methanohalophilus portucalensis FDF-1]RNI13499.1 restriction endonuclease subunit R [Methanohalophilus portucalensis FDF-1]SMH34720.1 type I restriction enzyme, R subunit [Methanohalophilus portucalensis FDF-1]
MSATNDTEVETRLDLIDSELEKWWVPISKYIRTEVNTVQSDFKNCTYILDDGTYKKGDKFIDYLLLADDNSPLAIIEAKKYSKDPDKGRIQARTYAKDIEAQIGRPIPIFLTNGLKWKFIDHSGYEREVSGPFSQDDLWRRLRLYLEQKDPVQYGVNPKIVDRKKSVEIVKILNQHFSNGYRSALIQMATGTGKTRVAMAGCDGLIQSRYVQNILFVADRSVLVTQANTQGFQKFFTEPIADLRNGFTNSSRLYTSTVQTLMTEPDGADVRMYQKFSPGFFDLIIYDEAHRSFYDKNNVVMEYFDSMKLGLTATPKSNESKNTYQLFGCDIGVPTAEYPYEDAVYDGVLVPYSTKVVETEVLTKGIDGSGLSEELKDQLRRQEENPDDLKFEGNEFDFIFMDNETNKLIIQTFLDTCYKSDDGLPSKTIFFCASIDHADHMKKMFDEVAPKIGRYVEVITSDKYRYEDEVGRFKTKSDPRIALSVGVLDTGVDIPEICNLVFIKSVRSSVRFWQMFGRGTRNQESCNHLEWLPNREKNNFFILDFKVGDHSNVEYHLGGQSEDKERKRIGLPEQIFIKRVALLTKDLNKEQQEIIGTHVIETVNSLDTNSHIVRKKLPAIEKIKKSSPFELSQYISDLNSEIVPLIMYNSGNDPNIMRFILEIEELYIHILNEDREAIKELKNYFEIYATNILQKDNLQEVKNNKSLILSMLQDKFWDDLTFARVDQIVREFAPLVKYYEPERGKKYQIDAPDQILMEKDIEFEVKDDPDIGNLLDQNPIAGKIRQGTGVTSAEIKELESLLEGLDKRLTIDRIQRLRGIDYLQFLRDILEIDFDDTPEEVIKTEFEAKVLDGHDYSTEQKRLLNVALSQFIMNKQIELSDFSHDPIAQYRPLDIFDDVNELEEIVDNFSRIQMY